jgi:hypothetical protein
MKAMLADISAGADPNVIAQLAIVIGGRHAHTTTLAILALFRLGYLQTAKAGGLEISKRGREVASINRANGHRS